MANKVSRDELKLMSELHRRGIPLDKDVLEDLESRSRGLSIYQTGPNVENTVFDLDSSGSGYMFGAALYNDSNRVIHLREFRLSIPWHEPQFTWLEDPLRKSPRDYAYSFPPHGPAGFGREVVLNHYVGRKLNPAATIEGLLLGVGQARVPDEYLHGHSIFMSFVVFDGQGECYETKMRLQIDRSGHGKRTKELSFETETESEGDSAGQNR